MPVVTIVGAFTRVGVPARAGARPAVCRRPWPLSPSEVSDGQVRQQRAHLVGGGMFHGEFDEF